MLPSKLEAASGIGQRKVILLNKKRNVWYKMRPHRGLYYAPWNALHVYYILFYSPTHAHGLETLRNKRLADAAMT